MKFETLQLHAGQFPDSQTRARAVPIYQSTSFVFESVEAAADMFALKKPGDMYTRISNPTNTVLEQRMAALEGGVGAISTASGTAAVLYSILNIAGAGDEIISAAALYGGTFTLFNSTLPRMGIKTHFVNSDDPDNFRAHINAKTKAIFVETIGNPAANLVDLEAVSKIAHENGLPLIVDNTFGTPYLIQPFEYGADISVHSATKYLGGHGTTIAGIIVDSGCFDWAGSGRFDIMTKPDPAYHDIVYTEEFKNAAYIAKARASMLRDTGACLAPLSSFLILQGIETLSLRMDRHVMNARVVVKFLNEHPAVEFVNYPELPDSPYYPLSQKYFKKGCGSIFSFGIKGGVRAGAKFIDSLKLFSHLANVADAKSLVIHPASTTHSQMNEAQLEAAGVSPGMIRLSVGLEHHDDLLEDLNDALTKATV